MTCQPVRHRIIVAIALVASLLSATHVAFGQAIAGTWGSSLYQVELTTSGDAIAGTFTSVAEPKGGPTGSIAGRVLPDGRTFAADWSFPAGPDTATFSTLLVLGDRDDLLAGYRWNRDGVPTAFALHRGAGVVVPMPISVAGPGREAAAPSAARPPAVAVPATPAAAPPEPAGQAGTFDPRTIAGEWTWVSGQRLVITADGRIEVWQGTSRINTATWTCTDPAARRFVFRHASGGWVDTVTLSADGNQLAGTNNAGNTVRGGRTGGAAATTPAPVAGPAARPATPADVPVPSPGRQPLPPEPRASGYWQLEEKVWAEPPDKDRHPIYPVQLSPSGNQVTAVCHVVDQTKKTPWLLEEFHTWTWTPPPPLLVPGEWIPMRIEVDVRRTFGKGEFGGNFDAGWGVPKPTTADQYRYGGDTQLAGVAGRGNLQLGGEFGVHGPGHFVKESFILVPSKGAHEDPKRPGRISFRAGGNYSFGWTTRYEYVWVNGEPPASGRNPLASAQTGQSRAADPAVGAWKWSAPGWTVILHPNGLADSYSTGQRNAGTWTLLDAGQRLYEIRWVRGPSIDVVTVSADGQRLDGANQSKGRVSATRLR